MRIYYVDEDPIIAADCLTTRATTQSILHYSQLLNNVHHKYGQEVYGMYKPNQMQHAYTAWVCESEENYNWLFKSLLKLLMNYAEQHHQEHKSRRVTKYIVKPPSGMDSGYTPVSIKGLPYKYRDRISSLEAHRSFYIDHLERAILQDERADFYYKIPEWTGLIEAERQPELIKKYTTFNRRAAVRYKRETCTIPIITSSVKNYLKRKELIEVDIRTVIDEGLDEGLDEEE